MSAQLGEQAGLGVAPDVIKTKARGVYGTGVLNLTARAVPAFWGIHKAQNNNATETNPIQEIALTDGRVKKFSFFIISHTLTMDAEIHLRINGSDAGTPIPLPASTGALTLLEGTLEDVEFSAGDLINFNVRFVSGGSGSLVAAPSTWIEFDSDAEGEFDADVYQMFSQDQSVASTRNYCNNDGAWTSGDTNQANHHILNDGAFISISGYVATGFSTIRAHLCRTRINAGVSNQIDWAIGETGFKQNDITEAFSKGDGLCLNAGQVSSGLEPMTCFIVFRMDEPET